MPTNACCCNCTLHALVGNDIMISIHVSNLMGKNKFGSSHKSKIGLGFRVSFSPLRFSVGCKQ